MMKQLRPCLGGLMIAVLFPTIIVNGADSWPTFRGPQRTGVSSDTGLMSVWPDEGPELLWTAQGAGRGYSSLAIADGNVYTIGDGQVEGEEFLVCFDQSSGQQLWKSNTGQAWNDGKESWQSSRSTPTVDADRIYVLTAHGELICFDDTGAEVWRKNLKEDFDGKKADGWGYSESVLIDGDKLLCTPGGPANTMVALDKETGETIWTTSRSEDRGAGHASIVIAEVGGTRVYVQTTGSGAMGVRAHDGKLLWTYDIKRTTAVIPTPIVTGDLVFFTAGYGTGGALLHQVASADGSVRVEEIYPNNPELGNKHGGVVLIDGFLYGDSDDNGIPFCANLMTGEIEWKSRGSGSKSASVTAADGNLFIRFSDGTMAIAQAASDEYQEQGSFKIPGSGDRPSWSHPVVVGGKLYLREGDNVLCYDLRG